ncbi:hypothetical protein MACH24_07090 [Erythrobacter sp. Dej080120_24]|uniref:hypothetical protein n=1 Tax=Erythrobacter sp. Dej080120_24 TaxID=3024837 RepID=UPI00291DBD2D|nr:hypothetical protein MACH24_07090 [Erythrobacter sp. Dej080120_24]
MKTFTHTRALCAALVALSLAACSGGEAPVEDGAGEAADATPQDEFWAALSSHCGKAYSGALVSDDAADADMAGAEMVMAVAECSADRIAVPFHIRQADGTWDRSRTWLITRNDAGGLRLKHDHRHEDGESDAVTMYGGDTAPGDMGTARVQSFPVDAESVAMFEREGLTASVTNVWTVEVDPAGTEGGTYAYQLKRTVEGGAPEDRLFRVEFDLSEEAEMPPPAWGWE